MENTSPRGLTEFFKLKIAVLFHDPPNKSWILFTRKHEEEAKKLATNIFKDLLPGIDTYIGDHRVKYADRIASTIDRWIIYYLTTYSKEDKRIYFPAFKTEYTGILKNIIDPRFSIRLSRPDDNDIIEFAKEFREILSRFGNKDPRLLYHLVYAFYEPLFYNKVSKGKGFVGSVADTRSPTHTIFDHLYASVMISNIIKHRDNKPLFDGYAVLIDLAGVQKFITASRKLRDLWLSSWIASLLTWITVWPFILALGPDIMVMPSPRNNPYYYSTLYGLLKDKGLLEEKDRDLFEKRLSSIIGRDNIDIPRFGVLPTQVLLLLPSIDVIVKGLREVKEKRYLPEFVVEIIDDFLKNTSSGDKEELLRKLFINIYLKAWKEIVEIVKNKISSERDDILNILRYILEDYDGWKLNEFDMLLDLIKDTPFLPIRVVVKNVVEILYKNDELVVEEYMVYDKIVETIYEELRRDASIKYSYPPLPPINQIYNTVHSKRNLSKRGYEYCSICGTQPAVLKMPSLNEWEKWFRNEDLMKKLNMNSLDELRKRLKKFEPFFSPGERLCIHDLIKRLLTLRNILKYVIDKLLYKEIRIDRLNIERIPWLSNIALADLYEWLYMKYEENENEFVKFVEKYLSEIEKPGLYEFRYRFLEKLDKEATKKYGNTYKETLAILVRLDPEDNILSREAREKWRRILSNYRDIRGKMPRIQTYYAIIRADADNMGKLLNGNVGEALGLALKDYLVNSFEEPIKSIVEHVVEGRIDEAKKLLMKEYEKSLPQDIDVQRVVNEVLEEPGNIYHLIMLMKKMGRIVLTPTYHVAISRALMINALIDQYIVEDKGKGFIVYSGGDDLLALSPVSTSLDVLIKTRRTFSLGSTDPLLTSNSGFLSIGLLEEAGLYRLPIPLIVSGSRSYSIAYTHYKYPLYVSLRISHDMLEEKDSVSFIIDGIDGYKKDMVSIIYVPRGHSIVKSIIPLKTIESINGYCMTVIGSIPEELMSSYNELVKKKISHSIINDLLNEQESIYAILDKSEDLYIPFIQRIVNRNKVKEEIKPEDTMFYKLLTKYRKYVLKAGGDFSKIPIELIKALKIFDTSYRGVT